jgi:PKHD-type hydroxylase
MSKRYIARPLPAKIFRGSIRFMEPTVIQPFEPHQFAELQRHAHEVRKLFDWPGIEYHDLGECEENKFNRWFVHNPPLLRKFHHSPLFISKISSMVGVDLKPSYVFLSMYGPNGVCPLHTDRPQCQYTVDLVLEQDEVWPIYVNDSPYELAPGKALLYSGTGHPHFRLMPYVLTQPRPPEPAEFTFHKSLFSAEECKQIISFHKNIPKMKATVGSSLNSTPNPLKRISELHWIEWGLQSNWIFERLAPNIVETNNLRWGFHLAGLNEALQLTRYKGGKTKGHYDWHEDHSAVGHSHRKISGVVLLNEGFKGGDFEFLHTGKVKELTVGTLVMFPSFKTHRVLPVTKGERWSLVFWVTGPPFC